MKGRWPRPSSASSSAGKSSISPSCKAGCSAPDCLELVTAADLLLPVPLHPRRLKARGFNQALLLAQGFPG